MKSSELFLVVAVILLAQACGPAVATDTALPPTASISPAEIARRAGERIVSADALHFVIELSGKLTYLDSPPTLALKHAEGDVVRPDKVRAIVKMSTMGVISQVAAIGLGDDQYITNPISQNWERLSAEQGWYFNPTLLFDPERGIESIIKDTAWDLAQEPDATDVAYYRLHGLLPGERIAALTFGMVTSGEVAIDIWVDKVDGFVQKIEIVELDSDPENPTRWLIELSDTREPVEIKPPPIP